MMNSVLNRRAREIAAIGSGGYGVSVRAFVATIGIICLGLQRPAGAADAVPPAVTNAIAVAASGELERKHIPSIAIALIGRDGVRYIGGWGSTVADRESTPTATTLYRAGSVSKLLTDIAVMRLVERGALDLDAPVQRYLSTFRPRNPYRTSITLRHLMTHRSGLVREAPRGNYFDEAATGQADTVASLNDTTLVAAPGTLTKYSNAGVAVVGEVVARVSGTSYDEAIAALVTGPSGMSASVFHRDRLRGALAWSQMVGFDAARFPAPEFDLGTPAAGGLYTTLEDLGGFVRMLLNVGVAASGERLLQPKTLESMWQPQSAGGYGLGFSVSELDGQRSVGHGGAIYGHMTYLRLLPQQGIGVVVFSTVDAGPAASRVGEFALRAWLASIEKRALPSFSVGKPIRGSSAKRMTGVFSNGTDSIETRLLDDQLYLEAPALAGFVTQHGDSLAIDDAQTYVEALRIAPDLAWIELDGQRYQRIGQRAPAKAATEWEGLLGEYGWDHNIQRIYVRNGRLYAQLEWTEYLPLERVAADEYAMPAERSFYPLEKLRFQRDRLGRVTGLELSGIVFPRRSARARARDLGVVLHGVPGPFNAITDVSGVEVGHKTLISGDGPLRMGRGPVRTGVTVVLPRGRASTTPVFAGWSTLNASGEMTGTVWLDERGLLDGPIAITNTHSVGVVRDALIGWMVAAGWTPSWHAPVVAETYDGLLNDINGFHVTAAHVREALAAARSGSVEEGAVGGGTGMICHRFKGGIGTSSRRFVHDARDYTVGVLVQCNYGDRPSLRMGGVPVGLALRDKYLPCQPGGASERLPACRPDAVPATNARDGSIIVIIATDAPLLPHQLKRVSKRASLALGRMGAISEAGSGDIFLAFSTGNLDLRSTEQKVQAVQVYPNEDLNPLFAAAVDATEEAILNALVAARDMTGANGIKVFALPQAEVREILLRHEVGPR